jgi:hypothetical protein
MMMRGIKEEHEEYPHHEVNPLLLRSLKKTMAEAKKARLKLMPNVHIVTCPGFRD